MWKCVTKWYNLQTISNSCVSAGNSSLTIIDHVLLKKKCHQNTQNMILATTNEFSRAVPENTACPYVN